MKPENLNRMRTRQLILLSPGIHLRRLSRSLGVSLSTTRYHVRGLEGDGEIVCSREGEYLRAYPASMADGNERRIYATLQHEAARIILKALMNWNRQSQEMTNGKLSVATGLSPSTVSEYAGVFRGLRLIRKVPAKEGGWVMEIEAENQRRISLMLAGLERNLAIVTDSFVDLWDF